MNRKTETSIKLALVILFLGCLADMPHGYYQLVRFAGMVGFALLAYLAGEKERRVELIIYVALAILFQPIVKINLGRAIWNLVDVLVSIGLLCSLFVTYRPVKNARSQSAPYSSSLKKPL